MIFDSPEWKLILKRYPLNLPEIEQLQLHVGESALVLHGIIMWAEAMAGMAHATCETHANYPFEMAVVN